MVRGHQDEEWLRFLAEYGVHTNPTSGEESQEYEWPFTQEDWQSVGEHPGGINELGQLACGRCGVVGQMQSLEWPPHSDGFWVSFREVCPLCGGPMPFLYDVTIN